MVKSDKYTGVSYNLLENGDKSYYVRYVVDGKRYDVKIGKHSEGIREAYCFKRRAELIHEARNGVVVDGKMSLDDLAAEYQSTKQANASYDELVARYKFKIKPYFKNGLIKRITEADVLKFQSSLIDTKIGNDDRLMAADTVNYYIQTLSSMLGYAVKKGYLKENVARNVKPLKVDNDRTRYLELSELKDLIDEVEHDDDLLMFVEMSMSTGARMGACMQVCKRDINMNSKTVSIKDEKGKEYYTAFLNDRVILLLEKRLKGLSLNDSIYTSKQRRMQRQMKKILDLLFNQDLDLDDRKNRTVIHTLRHTFASHLAINGVSIFKIKNLLNHKDIKQTMRYAKLAPDSGRDEVNDLFKLF